MWVSDYTRILPLVINIQKSRREIRERTADEIKKVTMKRKFVRVNSLYGSIFGYHEFPINSLHLSIFHFRFSWWKEQLLIIS